MPTTRKLALGGNGATRADLAAAPAPQSGGDGPLPDLAAAVAPASGGEGAISGDVPHLDAVPASDKAGLRTYVAPPTEDDQALDTRAQAFVSKFYTIFNSDHKNLHALYAVNAHLVWTLYKSDVSNELTSAKEIKDFWDSFDQPIMNCVAYCFVAQRKDSVTLIVVNGSCSGFTPHSTNYVQSFVLNLLGDIVSDILFVFKDGKPIRLPKGIKEKLEQGLPGQNFNQARRRSERIEQNRLRTCKQFEISAKSDAPSRKAMGKDLVESAGKKVSDSREPISVAILYDDVMLGHKPEYRCLETDARMMKRKGKYSHVERPERITCIVNRLIEDNLFDRAVYVTHRAATLQEILAVHRADYVRFINKLPLSPEDLDKFVGYYTKDMYCSTGTREAVYSAAGATIKACDVVIRDLFKKAFAIVRPPGHHAGNDEAEGFCYVNNIAVAAAYLRRVYGIKKKLVVDWDVHHGNGSEKLFYSTDEVLFFNIFNMNLDYPATSKELAERVGRGKGAGHNVNVPLSSGFGDSDLLYVWEHLLIPLIKAYSPDIILISCGFDAAHGDLLGECEVSAPCYATLLDMIVNAGNGKVVLSLEGGYNLEVVANCASHVVRAMVGDKESLLAESVVRAPPKDDTVEIVKEVKRNLQRFWDVFKQKPKQNRRR